MRCRTTPRGDAGTTITELVVVMFVLSIIIAATVTLTIGMQRTTVQTMARQDQVDVARTAVERMAKTVRTAVKPSQLTSTCTGCTADAFIKAQPYSVQFYANLDNSGNSVGPSRISYTIATTGPDAGVLIEKVQRPDHNVAGSNGYEYCDPEAPGATTDCKGRLSTTRLATGVQTGGATPTFVYFDQAGTQLIPGSLGLDASQMSRMLSVELTLTVQKQVSNRALPTTYIQRVLLPNTQAVLRPW